MLCNNQAGGCAHQAISQEPCWRRRLRLGVSMCFLRRLGRNTLKALAGPMGSDPGLQGVASAMASGSMML
eukprot:2370789-Amphidinium_carterae.1